jgi:hypothetical protein
VGQSYGLSTGAGDAFALAPVDFFNGGESGGGVFLFHIKPLADGIVFSAAFPSAAAGGGAWLEVAVLDGAVALRIGEGGAFVEETLFHAAASAGSSGLRDFIPAAVEFYATPGALEARLALGESASASSAVRAVAIAGSPLSGEARVSLGGPPSEFAAAYALSAEAAGPAMVWDEFAVLLSAKPFSEWEAADGMADADAEPYPAETEEAAEAGYAPPAVPADGAPAVHASEEAEGAPYDAEWEA